MTCIVKINPNKKKNTPFQFVTDQDEREGKWNKTTLTYDIVGKCRTMSLPQVKKALNFAMTTWEIDTGIKCIPAWGNINADIKVDFKSKDQDQIFKDEPSVLAYAYFPRTILQGKLVFNNTYLWDFLGKGISAEDAIAKGWVENVVSMSGKLKTYSIVAVIIHELGHTFGLTHDVSGNVEGTDVMDAYYSGIDRLELSDRDIQRIRTKYGERQFKHAGDYDRLKNAVRLAKLRL